MVQVCVGGRAQGIGAYCRHVGSHTDTTPGPAHIQPPTFTSGVQPVVLRVAANTPPHGRCILST